MGHAYGASTYGFSASNVSQDQVESIESDPRVAYVEIDATIQIDPMEMQGDRRQLKKNKPDNPGKGGGGGGGGGDGGGETTPPVLGTPWGVARVGGYVDCTYGCGTAWIIDSGIDLDHPDLNIDVERSASFVKGKPSADDENGHGTHMAGTVAAIDNEFGVVGVAAGAEVVSVR